jgi:UDP-glucose 4-epimerase
MRDFIHVWDLALAHVRAIARFHEILPRGEGSRFEAVNVATGRGTTVIELLAAVEEATGRTIAVRRAPPRPGDIAGVYSRSQRSRQVLRWRPSLSLSDAIRHALRWAELRDGVLNPATDAQALLPPGAAASVGATAPTGPTKQ